jgi:protein-S-isoprenylcysteine O-methyltransferase Ste14|tara:strand:- start:1 stop:465 length:465 start_codon:yes stop_codon:yes gene_type:complete
MNSKSRAYTLVLMQFLLIALLLLSPRQESPYGGVSEIVGVFGVGLIALGSGVLLVSFIGLGNSLTALAIPKDNGTLVTHGIYSRVRHPIYFGLLVMSFGVMLDAGYWPQVIVVMLLYVLLSNKADFEESMLRERYPQYKKYAERTPRFFPRLGR